MAAALRLRPAVVAAASLAGPIRGVLADAAADAASSGTAAATKEHSGKLAMRHSQALSIWSIGQGFEGTASDWTEYVVWLVGFISLVWFIWNRNIQALPDDDFDLSWLQEQDGEGDGDGDGEDDPADASKECSEEATFAGDGTKVADGSEEPQPSGEEARRGDKGSGLKED